MLETINLRPLHNGEFLTFTDEFLKILNGPTLPASVTATRDQLAALHGAISAAHIGHNESELSQERRELDVARDEQYSGLRQLAASYCSNRTPEKRAAARRITARIDNYGTVKEVTQQPDADETADIKSLLRDLRSPDYAPAVALIGAGDWVDELDRLQAAYDAKTTDRNNQRGERLEAHPENIETLRISASSVFRKLCHKINSFHETEEGAAPWPGIISKGNALITDTRQRLAARKGRAKSEAPAATPPAGA